MMLAVDPSLGPQEVMNILRATADSNVNAPVGELNLTLALDEVMSQLGSQKASACESKELRKLYREKLKVKMKKIIEMLWK